MLKKIFFLLLFSGFIKFGFAQTGIGTTTPNASAKLDVYSTNKGFLPPRVTLTSVTDATTIASPAEGLLVYNLGSVGLQSGYYYWNGANWATIATASSAGNGVVSADLFKLYQEGYSTASGKAPSTDGYSFTVPVSGRYEFNFNSTGWNSNGSTIKLTFNVRNGTTVLGSDYHQSTSSNVWAEYEGRVEVNLNAGVTYNVQVVTTTGNRDYRDFDKIFYKQIAGNLPVTGQSVDYVSVMLTSDQSNSSAGQNVKFQTIQSGNIPYDASTGNFSLTAGKTYRLTALASLNGTSPAASALDIIWRTADGVNIGPIGSLINASSNINYSGQGVVDVIYTPTRNITVSLYISYVGNSTTVLRSYSTNATITQIGSSAIVNPWTLSGTNTYNTTGNVGIGTNAPSQALDVTGNVNVTGKINVTDPAGNVATKVAAFVARGVDVTLGNLKVRFPISGNMSLQVSTVSGTYSVYGSQVLVSGAVAYSAIDGGSPLSVTTTPTYLNSVNNFVGAGNICTWNIMDTSAAMSWRITMIIGLGYNNNFISIERLL
jgi:hypothetical protein